MVYSAVSSRPTRTVLSFLPRTARGFVVAGLAVTAFGASAGCAVFQNSAGRDPMKCERDPDCAKRSDKSADCVTQCADNLSCIDRCRSVTGQR